MLSPNNLSVIARSPSLSRFHGEYSGRRGNLFVSILIVVFLLTTCAQSESTYTVEIIDGVRTVHNIKPLWGDEPKIELQFVRKIGGLDEEDINFQFFKPMGLEIDGDGNIYINDSGNFRIQKFDAEGEYLKTFGSKGMGPAEFLSIGDYALDKSGNLYIDDIIQRKIKVLDQTGKEIFAISDDETVGDFPKQFVFLESGSVLGKTNNIFGEENLLKIFDLSTNGFRTIIPLLYSSSDSEEFAKSRMFNRFSFFADRIDNIYITYSFRNRIEKYSDSGKLLLRIDRELNYEITNSIRKTEKIIGGKAFLMNDINSVSAGIGVDSMNRIWVRTFERQKKDSELTNMIASTSDGINMEYQTFKNEDSDKPKADLLTYHIFDSDGILLGKLPAKSGGSFKIYKNRLFFIDTYNEMCVYEYKIVDK